MTSPLLKSAFEAAGFSDVSTYINSGNVLFSAMDDDTTALQKSCRQVLKDKFRLDISVAVVSTADYSDALSHAPE